MSQDETSAQLRSSHQRCVKDAESEEEESEPEDYEEVVSSQEEDDSCSEEGAAAGEEHEELEEEEEEFPGVMHEPEAHVLHQRMVQLLEMHSLPCQDQLDWGTDEEQGTLGWAQAAHKRLTDTCPQSQLVVDYCYDHVLSYRKNVKSRKVADEECWNNAHRQFPHLSPPDPAGFRNCWPPSLECCEAVLKKPDLDRYLIHVCPNGCEHWWTHMPDYKRHFKDCQGCSQCRCPHCDGHRFVHDRHGLRGGARCWFFHDAFQQMMLDADLACDILTGRACRNDQTAPDTDPMKPSLAKYSEGKPRRRAIALL
jgi:hypothetical protein